MEFIEDHTPHAVEGWIRLQPSQKQAIGHDFDLCALRTELLSTNGVTDQLADGLVEALSESFGGGASGQTSWLNDPDAPLEGWAVVLRSQPVDQGQGDTGGFPCTRRCLQEHSCTIDQQLTELR